METVHVGPAPRIAADHAGSGPLVVFLHGIGGNRSNWREQMEAFAPRFHVVAWDARGYGASDDYEGPLDFADFSRDLARLIAHFGESSAHLVGLSMGGMIVQDFYRRWPEKVRSLVLADTRNGFQRHNTEEFLKKREAPLLAGLEPKDIAPSLAPSLVGPSASPAVLARLVESVSALRKGSYLKVLRATTLLPQHPEFRSRDSFVDLDSIAVPTLVVCGTEDGITPPPMSKAIADGVEGAKLVWIEGVGHLSNIEAPEKFNAALGAFLDAQA